MTLRTFFVEDNPTIRQNLIETLQELADIEPLGYAETEAHGCAWLSDPSNEWDLAIVDLFLAQGSGLGVVAACQNRKPDQFIIVLSNYATPDVRQRCKELGVNAVFDKSNEIDALLDFCMEMA